MGPPRAPCRPWLPCGALALLTCLFAFHGLLAAGPGGAGLPPALSGRLCWGRPCAGGKGCAGESAANDGPGGGGSAAAAQPAAPPAGPAAGEAGRPVGAGAAAGAEAGSPEAAAQPAGPGAAAGAAEGPAGASQAESEAKARADAEAEAKAAAEASAKANAEASAKADAEATAKVDAGATANSDTDATTKADVEANAKADAQAMAEAHAEGTDGVELKQPVAVGAGEEVNWPPDVPQVPDEDVALFRQNFRKILSWWHTPLPKPSAKVKLLIMVTTIPKEAKLREVHRETWMSLPGICILTNDVVQEPPGCSAFVAFFVGFDNKTDAYLRKEMSAQKDIVLLDTFDRWDFRPIPVKRPPRNWKGRKEGKVWVPSEHLAKPSFNGEVKGKVLKSFQYAWKNFPWVTHYAKNDMDNFPYVAEILEDLEDLPHSRAGIKSKDIMPTSNPTPWVEGHGVYYGRYQGRYFMQGQFYILSRPVLECIFKRTDVQACKGKPGEDAMVGCLVTNTYNVSRSSQAGLWWSRGGPCPEPWRLAVDSGQDQHGRSVARWCPCKPKQCPIGLGPLENFCRHEYPA